jgi:hypothetical protein
MPKAEGIASDHRTAHYVNTGICDTCPAVHIDMFDEEGVRFARAGLPIESVDAFCKGLQQMKAQALLRVSAPERQQ